MTTSESGLNVTHTLCCKPHAPTSLLTRVDCVLMFPGPFVVLAFREIMVSNLDASWRTCTLHFSACCNEFAAEFVVVACWLHVRVYIVRASVALRCSSTWLLVYFSVVRYIVVAGSLVRWLQDSWNCNCMAKYRCTNALSGHPHIQRRTNKGLHKIYIDLIKHFFFWRRIHLENLKKILKFAQSNILIALIIHLTLHFPCP